MAEIELRLVEIEEALHEESVVVQEGGDGGVAFAIAAQQRARRGIVEAAGDEGGGAARGLGVAGLLEHGAAFGEGGDHELVPGGEDFIVGVRSPTVRLVLSM